MQIEYFNFKKKHSFPKKIVFSEKSIFIPKNNNFFTKIKFHVSIFICQKTKIYFSLIITVTHSQSITYRLSEKLHVKIVMKAKVKEAHSYVINTQSCVCNSWCNVCNKLTLTYLVGWTSQPKKVVSSAFKETLSFSLYVFFYLS